MTLCRSECRCGGRARFRARDVGGGVRGRSVVSSRCQQVERERPVATITLQGTDDAHAIRRADALGRDRIACRQLRMSARPVLRWQDGRAGRARMSAGDRRAAVRPLRLKIRASAPPVTIGSRPSRRVARQGSALRVGDPAADEQVSAASTWPGGQALAAASSPGFVGAGRDRPAWNRRWCPRCSATRRALIASAHQTRAVGPAIRMASGLAHGRQLAPRARADEINVRPRRAPAISPALPYTLLPPTMVSSGLMSLISSAGTVR